MSATVLLTSCQAEPEHDLIGAAARPDVPVMVVGPPPAFTMAGVEIGADSAFFDPFISGTFTSDGHIVVALGDRDNRLVVLDSLGSARIGLSRTGQGPGELMRINRVAATNDTVAVWDGGNRKVVVFVGGRWSADIPLLRDRRHVFVGLTDDGYPVTTPPDGFTEGERRPYWLSDHSGVVTETLFGSPEASSPSVDVESSLGAPVGFFVLGPPCAPVTMHATVENRVLIADAARGELLSLDRSGVLRTIYRTTYRDTVRASFLTKLEDLMDAFGTRGTSLSAASRREIRDRFGDAGAPLANVWSAMVPDVSGGVWLQRSSCYNAWLGDDTTVWEVVDPEGRPTAVVRVPAGLTVISVKGHRVLVATEDEFGVPHLEVYHTRRFD